MPLMSFEELTEQCIRDLENVSEEESLLQRAMIRNFGKLTGYYLAGGVNHDEYQSSCNQLRRVINQRRALRSVSIAYKRELRYGRA